jgi:predicted nucleic acid-binding protein
MQPHVDFMIREQFKVSSNFMDNVLKWLNYMNIIFTNFTALLYALAVQIWRVRQKFFRHIIIKNSKFIEACIKLEYRVQINVFEVEK